MKYVTYQNIGQTRRAKIYKLIMKIESIQSQFSMMFAEKRQYTLYSR